MQNKKKIIESNQENEIISERLQKIYTILFSVYGPQGWWPTVNSLTEKSEYHKGNYKIPETDEQKFQIVIGALLTQNTAWTNVEKALEELSKKNLLNPNAIVQEDKEILAMHIRSAGYFRQKAERLQGIAKYIISHPQFLNTEITEIPNLRKELLSLKGIGPETADSIILYAVKKPIFVIDAYTKRIISRIGFCSESSSYETVQNIFMKNLPLNVELFNEYHALLVELAKKHCKTKPDCKECPLIKECDFYKSSIRKSNTHITFKKTSTL